MCQDMIPDIDILLWIVIGKIDTTLVISDYKGDPNDPLTGL
jgi:hypothetical protein